MKLVVWSQWTLLVALILNSTAFAKNSFSLLEESWGGYMGAGFSGATSGRLIPGAHFAGHFRYVAASFYTTGTTSNLFSESHQIGHLGFPLRLFRNSWFQVDSSFGLGAQHSLLRWNGELAPSESNVLDEFLIGPSQAVQACVSKIICLRLEGLYGLLEESTELIFQETALGSIGILL